MLLRQGMMSFECNTMYCVCHMWRFGKREMIWTPFPIDIFFSLRLIHTLKCDNIPHSLKYDYSQYGPLGFLP